MNVKNSAGQDPEQPAPAGPASYKSIDLRPLEVSSTLYYSVISASMKKDKKEGTWLEIIINKADLTRCCQVQN